MLKRNLKKNLSVVLIIIITFTTIFLFKNTNSAYTTNLETDNQENEIKYGDVNGDGFINVSDGVMIKKHLAGISIQIDKLASDVNLDKNINITDAVLLMKYLAGMDIELGIVSQPTPSESILFTEKIINSMVHINSRPDFYISI